METRKIRRWMWIILAGMIFVSAAAFTGPGASSAYAADAQEQTANQTQEQTEDQTADQTEAQKEEQTTPTPADPLAAKYTPPEMKIKKAELLTKKSIRIIWNKNKKADGYYVYRLTSEGKLKKLKTIKTNAITSYTDTGLKYGNTYKYVVRAYKKYNGKIYQSDYDKKGFAKKLKVKSKYKKNYKYYYDMDNQLITDVTPFIGKKKSYRIKVNIQKNVVTVYAKDGKKGYTIPVKVFLCSGMKYDKLGTYSLGARYRYRSLWYNCYSQWALRIHGSILFHTVPYKKSRKPNSLDVKEYNKLGTPASHGCIRLQCSSVKWIYDNCKAGTKVVFYKSSNPGPLGKPKLEKLPKWHTWDPTDPTMKSKCKKKNCNHLL